MATEHPTRRRLLQTGVTGLLTLSFSGLAKAGPPIYAGCRRANDGTYHASLFTEDGAFAGTKPLPARGHGLSPGSNPGEVLAFARRPGLSITGFGRNAQDNATHIATTPDRHFYGHGCLNADGTRLYTTENRTDTGEGLLIVRDATRNCTQLHEIDLGGIGPHEVVLLDDDKTLAIAIGGIRTHPDSGRTKLNLETMAPALLLMNADTGHITHRLSLPSDLHQLSIRHLASLPGRRVACALQYEGPKSHRMPLLAIAEPEAGLVLPDAPDAVLRAMRNYAGSIVTDSSGALIAMSHPRSHMVTFWSSDDLSYLGQQSHPDACGLAAMPEPGRFVVTGKEGRIAQIGIGHGTDLPLDPEFDGSDWDNHLIRLA